MKLTHHIKKIFIISCWCIVAAGLVVLLVAAMKVKNEKVCRGYEININNAADGLWFVDKKEVVLLLTKNGTQRLSGKHLKLFDLQKMESQLAKNVWIQHAELYFDNNNMLQVNILQREPVARIFTATGYSFYIDSSGAHLPLSDKMSARLPVFTGFPTDKIKLKRSDSLLMEHIQQVSMYILKHSFWMAQVSQIDITPQRTFEIIPTIGNHTIEFGDGENCEKKFRRLMVFYKQVLSKTGTEQYARLNVQYDKQVIAVKNSYLTKTDSVRSVKNIEYLIASSSDSAVHHNDSLAKEEGRSSQ